MSTRRLVAFTIIAAAAAAWTRAAIGPRYGGELRVTLVASGTTAAPDAVPDATERFVRSLTHESLLGLGADGSLVPRLAQEWTPGPATGEWRLTLETGLQFHDRTPLGAAQVVRSLRQFLRSPSPSARVLAERLDGGTTYRRGESDDLPALVAEDDVHVRLRFAPPTSTLDLLPLAAPSAIIVSERDAGCGPFVPTVRSGEERLFVAFGGHIHGRPYLDRVRVHLTTDARHASADLRQGRAHVLPVGSDAPPTAQDRPAPVRRVLVLVLSTASPVFVSAEARSAVAAAIDRDVLARRVLADAEPWSRLRPEDGPLPAPRHRGESPTALRAAAVTLAVDRSLPPLISQRIVAHLAALGLTARVQPLDADAVRMARADLRLFVFEPELPDPALALNELAGLDPSLRDVAGAAAVETDASRRQELADEAERVLLESGAFLPLARLVQAPAVADTVHGLALSPGALRLEDAWLEP
jgi:ABC-type transport system substrate-binding protein